MNFQKKAKYAFYEDPYTLFEYIRDEGFGARFKEYRLEPSDGAMEEVGEIYLDAYQITLLHLFDAEGD